jgi:hypothetical protein
MQTRFPFESVEDQFSNTYSTFFVRYASSNGAVVLMDQTSKLSTCSCGRLIYFIHFRNSRRISIFFCIKWRTIFVQCFAVGGVSSDFDNVHIFWKIRFVTVRKFYGSAASLIRFMIDTFPQERAEFWCLFTFKTTETRFHLRVCVRVVSNCTTPSAYNLYTAWIRRTNVSEFSCRCLLERSRLLSTVPRTPWGIAASPRCKVFCVP